MSSVDTASAGGFAGRAASPFDGMATEYDRAFTSSLIGKAMRERIWRRLDARFAEGWTILEVNCGTGEDAVYLARRGVRVTATDSSEVMVGVAQEKAAKLQLGHAVEVRRLAIEDLAADRQGQPKYDGLLSNFGGLNCVADLPAAAQVLAEAVRPGGALVLCVMGPIVPWEWAWFLARGDVRRAFRRVRTGGVEWRGIRVTYPTIGEVRRAFAPSCRTLRVSGLGALMPPPFAESWAARHPRLFQALSRLERGLEALPPLPLLADHYVLEMERRA